MWGPTSLLSLYLRAELGNGWNTSHSFDQKHLGFIRGRRSADCKVRGPPPSLRRIAGVSMWSHHLLPKPGRLVVTPSASKQAEEVSSLVLEFGDSSQYMVFLSFLIGFIFKDSEKKQLSG